MQVQEVPGMKFLVFRETDLPSRPVSLENEKLNKILEELHNIGEQDSFLDDRVIPFRKIREVLTSVYDERRSVLGPKTLN